MKNLAKTKWFIFGTYLLLVLATLLIGFILLRNNNSLNRNFISFFEVAESRSFDYRQSLQIARKHRLMNRDIVILTIDEASVESLWDKYGEWPIPRSVYADLVTYLEKQNPQSIIFDFMFIKSLKSSENADKYFVDTLNKYNNIYVGMNFDDRDFDVRKPIDLPQKMEVNLNNTSNVNIVSYPNCRPILSDLLNSPNIKISMLNVERDEDGILRRISPLLKYKNKYYPYLGFDAAADYLTQNNKQFYIDNKKNMIVNDVKIPLTNSGDAILNWYYAVEENNTIPFYKVLKAQSANNYSEFDFRGKTIFIGTTAEALYDLKSVPIARRYPGVFVQATSYNNMLDNNFIKRTETIVNILILFAVISIVGGIVMLSTSTIFAFLSTALFAIGYLFVSYYCMELYNLWIPVVLPTLAVIFAFTLSILAKYIMKSRDFDYQYKLATIDGLTELYNHRYFQDTLRKQMDIARRYEQHLSLIICDIDFFKKFNDTYGHQAGDAVLRQVAQTLKNNSRVTDSVCRYGGEEMSIILPNTNAEEALMLANRICSAVSEKPFHLTPVDTAEVTISLGVATFPDNAQTPQDLIEWADKGLYYAKEHGRNQVGRY